MSTGANPQISGRSNDSADANYLFFQMTPKSCLSNVKQTKIRRIVFEESADFFQNGGDESIIRPPFLPVITLQLDHASDGVDETWAD
jgi:hypothetical protein